MCIPQADTGQFQVFPDSALFCTLAPTCTVSSKGPILNMDTRISEYPQFIISAPLIMWYKVPQINLCFGDQQHPSPLWSYRTKLICHKCSLRVMGTLPMMIICMHEGCSEATTALSSSSVPHLWPELHLPCLGSSLMDHNHFLFSHSATLPGGLERQELAPLG